MGVPHTAAEGWSSLTRSSTPTGRAINVDEISIFRIENGRVAEQWCLNDDLAFDKQTISRDMIVVIQALVILFAGALEHMFRPALARLFAPGVVAQGGRA